MKFLLSLALVVALVIGCIWAYKKFLAAEDKTIIETVETVKEPESVKVGQRPAVDNLSTARTPVAKSKIGKKINKIYSDHNRGVENSTK
ncbi:MAG: hypothetical protein PHS31_01690 [Victivallaceae bacterium]|nr:hypothetical protein [Victivallaceae bacterium]MDD4180410.1 hypothetical protein [Victivallaceae bacterium]